MKMKEQSGRVALLMVECCGNEHLDVLFHDRTIIATRHNGMGGVFLLLNKDTWKKSLIRHCVFAYFKELHPLITATVKIDDEIHDIDHGIDDKYLCYRFISERMILKNIYNEIRGSE